jgi:hypothetical protein
VPRYRSQGPITPVLARWRLNAPRASERTVIVRTSPSLDPDSLVRALIEAGVDVHSSGHGVSTVRVKPDSLDRLAQVSGVVAIEEPKELFPRAGFFKGG